MLKLARLLLALLVATTSSLAPAYARMGFDSYGTGRLSMPSLKGPAKFGPAVDLTQQWIAAANLPSVKPPVDATAAPAFGTLAAGATNLAAIDFTPGTGATKVNTRSALDSISYYGSVFGNQFVVVGSNGDDPTNGQSYARMRYYPAGHPYDLHTFTADGLKLGVVGKNNDAKPYTYGNVYAGGIGFEEGLLPGMSWEIVSRGTSDEYGWMPEWATKNARRSAKRLIGPNAGPYDLFNGRSLMGYAQGTVNGQANTDLYLEYDAPGDFYTKAPTADIKHTLSIQPVRDVAKFGASGGDATVDTPYIRFLPNSNGFATVADSTGTFAKTTTLDLSAQFNTWLVNWRTDNLVQVLLNGVLVQEFYHEYVVNTWVNPETGVTEPVPMSLLIGGQAIAQFAPGAQYNNVTKSFPSINIADRDGLSKTIKSIKIWKGNLDQASITKPANGVPLYNTLTLATTGVQPGSAFSSAVSGKSANSKIRATSSDGTPLSVAYGNGTGGTSAFVSGTFASAGSPVVTLVEVPYSVNAIGMGVLKTSTTTVTVSASYTPPASAAQAFDPANANTALTLSNSNTTVTNTSGSNDKQVRLTRPMVGKSMVSFVLNAANGNNGDPGGAGLMGASHSAQSTTYLGGEGNTLGDYRGSIVTNSGNGGSLGATQAVGQQLDICYDNDNHLFWHRIGNGNWNDNASANPATGVGGRSWNPGESGVYAAIQANNGGQWTVVNTGTPPAGFSYP